MYQSNFKQIIDKVTEFANLHDFVKTFNWGNIMQLDANETTYPIVYMVPINTVMENTQISYNFDIIFADVLQSDRGNLKTITNTNLEIAKDFVRYFQEQPDVNNFWIDESNVTCAYAEEKYKDNVQGWIMNVTFQSNFDISRCSMLMGH